MFGRKTSYLDRYKPPKPPKPKHTHLDGPGVEIRIVRVIVILALVTCTIVAGYMILRMREAIVQENKLEIGMVLGWLIAKAGTAVDWLLGSSESGTRRSDVLAHRANSAPPEGSSSISVPNEGKAKATIETPAEEGGE